MSRNGSGTYTLPAGNPVVTGTTIESNWANTTLSDIATTLTDSLSRSGQGGMTAALRVADGTQGAPGVGFANETGSGFYRAGTGEVWAVVQGAQTLNLDANGVYVPADKTTTVDGAFVFNEAGADKDARFEGDTDANLLFTDASTDRVGIGTNTPDAKLTVNGVAAVGDGAEAAPSLANTGDLNTGLWFPAADTVAVSTGGVEAARFDSSGNLGLGVTPSGWSSTYKPLEMGNSGNFIAGRNGVAELDFGCNAYFNAGWKYGVTGTASLLQQDGNVFKWYTAPSGTAGNAITFTQAMTLDASGNLLVGTTSVYGVEGLSVIPNASAGAVNLYWNRTATASTSTAATFSDGGTPIGTITYTNTAVAYNTTSDYRLKNNQQPLTGSGAFIDALQPKTWEWKTDGSRGVGFIAHEAQAVSPSSVVGEKDAVDEEGKPIMQAMEYGSAEFIANIIAELQSLRARVAALEAQ